MSTRYTGEQKSDGSVISEVKKLFRNIFFNEYEESRTFIILLWNKETFLRVLKDKEFRKLFDKVKDSFYSKHNDFTSNISVIPNTELKIIKSGKNYSETLTIFVDFMRLKLITNLIGELLENINPKVLERIIENHYHRYLSEFIHLLTIKILFLLLILKGE
ncbi:MAG: hypothetical protein KJI71_00400 [Patescibacteria group bacterium]|nr:hypothetical protein [Patescibacteria group bacterium]